MIWSFERVRLERIDGRLELIEFEALKSAIEDEGAVDLASESKTFSPPSCCNPVSLVAPAADVFLELPALPTQSAPR